MRADVWRGVVLLVVLVWRPSLATATLCDLPEAFVVPAEATSLPPDPVIWWFSMSDELLVEAGGEPVPIRIESIEEGMAARIVRITHAGDAELVISELGDAAAHEPGDERFDGGAQERARVELARHRIGGAIAPVPRGPVALSFGSAGVESPAKDPGVAYLWVRLRASVDAPMYRVTWRQGIRATGEPQGGIVLVPGNGSGFTLGRFGPCDGFAGPWLDRGVDLEVSAVGLFVDGSESPPAPAPLIVDGHRLYPSDGAASPPVLWIVAGACLLVVAVMLTVIRLRR
ncbi:MAG TPA: hypothetical protein VML75_22700 [Kofleriaceae bacterium]|nr:hypothetical protein [Kofleriaceae bacterium]